MKRAQSLGALSALAALPFAFAGRAEAAGEATPPAAVADVVSREVVAFNAHDAAAVTKFHAPDASLTLLPSGKVLASGSEQLLAFFTKTFAAMPHVQLTLASQVVLGSVVVNHYTSVGGAAADFVSIYDVKNGVIANEWAVFG